MVVLAVPGQGVTDALAAVSIFVGSILSLGFAWGEVRAADWKRLLEVASLGALGIGGALASYAEFYRLGRGFGWALLGVEALLVLSLLSFLFRMSPDRNKEAGDEQQEHNEQPSRHERDEM